MRDVAVIVAGTEAGRRRKFRSDRTGTIVIKFAVLAPVALLTIGGSLDYGMINHQKSKLQAAADAGAIAAAKELGLADFKSENLNAIVDAVVNKYMGTNHADVYGGGRVLVESEVQTEPLEVDVTASQPISSPWSGAFGLGVEEISVRAVARIVGRPNICVLGLDASEAGTISLEQNALVTGNNCAVF